MHFSGLSPSKMLPGHDNVRGEFVAIRRSNDVVAATYSQPEVLEDGRLRLHETWRWTNGDRSADETILDEIR